MPPRLSFNIDLTSSVNAPLIIIGKRVICRKATEVTTIVS